MKKIIITAIIFLTVIVGSIFTIMYTNATFTALSANLKKIELYLHKNEWQIASTKIKNLCKKFENQEKNLQLFLKRENMKEIEQNLNRLKIAIQFKEKPKSMAQILKLKNSFDKIIKDEKPLLYNIL